MVQNVRHVIVHLPKIFATMTSGFLVRCSDPQGPPGSFVRFQLAH
jgi:hypothetical protein